MKNRLAFYKWFFLLLFICPCMNVQGMVRTVESSIYLIENENYQVITKKLNVRSAPSTNANVVGSLSNGDIVDVKSIQNGWAIITYKGKKCYVKADYLKAVTKSKQSDKSENNSRQSHKPQESVSHAGSSYAHNQQSKTSVKTNGWKPFVELQPVIVCAKGAKPRFELLGGVTHGLSNYVSLGAGIGVSSDFNSPATMPLFARLAIEDNSKSFSPLLLLDAGYDFNFKEIKASTIRLNPTLGIKTGGLYAGVGYLAAIPTQKEADVIHNVNFKLGYEFNSKNSAFNRSMRKFFKKTLPNFLKKTYLEAEVGGGIGLSTDDIGDNETETFGKNIHFGLSWLYEANNNWNVGIGAGYRNYYFEEIEEFDAERKFYSIPIFIRNRVFFLQKNSGFRPYVGLDLGLNIGTSKYIENGENKQNGYEETVDKASFTKLIFRPQVGVELMNRFNVSLSYTQTSADTPIEYKTEKTRSVNSLDLTLGVRLW